MPTSTMAAALTAPFDHDDRYSPFNASHDGAGTKVSSSHHLSSANGNSGPALSNSKKPTAGDNPEMNDDGFTNKSDSGIYFAMILSEYLDRQAMGEEVSEKQKQKQQQQEPTITRTPLTTTLERDSSAPLQTTTSCPSEAPSSNPWIEHSSEDSTTTTTMTTLSAAEAQAKEVIASLPNLIWVPAHKHPEIAPSEFVNWIQVHGANATIQKSKVRRQKSRLSSSISYDEMADNEKDSSTTTSTTTVSLSSGDDSPASPKDHVDLLLPLKDVGNLFDQKVDDSAPILPPPPQTPSPGRTLLRRSAVSARRAASEPGLDKGRRNRRLAPQPRHAVDVSHRKTEPVPPEGIHLHDHPVNMSEWIDLGDASLESTQSEHGILSRVHDAESQLLSIMDDDTTGTAATGGQSGVVNEAKEPDLGNANEAPSSDMPTLPEVLPTTTTKTPSPPDTITTPTTTLPLHPSPSVVVVQQKLNKKSSWLGSLLTGGGDGTKKKKRTSLLLRRTSSISDRPSEASLQLSRVNSMNSVESSTTSAKGNKKRGLAAFLSRSLSIKSSSLKKNARKSMQEQQQSVVGSRASASNGTIGTSKHYINSYRLPIHVERAMYRLSHMKLANPRRPLHQQVAISNFMFWYLSIINPNPQQQQQQQQSSVPDTRSANASNNTQWSNEARFSTHHHRTPKTQRKSAGRRVSQTSSSSSDEEDNVPLSFYRK